MHAHTRVVPKTRNTILKSCPTSISLIIHTIVFHINSILFNLTYENITPSFDHVCCVIDGYSRHGELQQAQDFIYAQNSQNIVMWKTLLGGVRSKVCALLYKENVHLPLLDYAIAKNEQRGTFCNIIKHYVV